MTTPTTTTCARCNTAQPCEQNSNSGVTVCIDHAACEHRQGHAYRLAPPQTMTVSADAWYRLKAIEQAAGRIIASPDPRAEDWNALILAHDRGVMPQ